MHQAESPDTRYCRKLGSLDMAFKYYKYIPWFDPVSIRTVYSVRDGSTYRFRRQTGNEEAVAVGESEVNE
jgi:hypothetical protein